ncbi:zinc-binding dehydrogenase [Streptomyces mirabilis]
MRGHRRGGPEQLTYGIAPCPVPGRGEVLVGVRSASVTPDEPVWDATWTDSFDGSGRERGPVVPSKEVSGVVAALGPEVSDRDVGDEVYGLIPCTRDGAAAQFVAVPADVLAAEPARLDPDRTGLEELSRLVADGELARPVDRALPLAETAQAYAALEQGHRRGKIELHVS